MNLWKEYRLEDVIDTFIDYRGKTPKKSDAGIPLVTAKVVKAGRILAPNEFIPEEEYDNWMIRGYPQKNDVVLTTEAPLGEVALIKDENIALAQRIITMRGKPDIVSNVFLKYYLQSDQGQYELDSRASGTTVFGIKASVLRKLPVLLPELPEQHAIASVLSSLDDKIDLLHRQNQTLEQMAETLFRQWFVEEESELVPLGKCIKTTSGGTPLRKKLEYYENGIYPWVKSKELKRGYIVDTEEKITEEAINRSSAKFLPANSVLIAMYGATVGEYAITSQEATCNQAICACIPNENFPYTFLYYTIKANIEELKSRAVGSAQQNISQVLIKSLEIAVNHKIGYFHLEVEPMLKRIKLNHYQIRSLERLRNTLLPKLMDGSIRIS